MPYFEDTALKGIDTSPKAVVFAKTDGKPRLIRLHQAWRYLDTGKYIKDPNKADNLDRAMVKIEMARVMNEALKKVRLNTFPRLIKPVKDISKRFHEAFEKAFKAKYG